MSRIGKQIIEVPEKTEITVQNNTVSVKGPGGELKRAISSAVTVHIEGGKVQVKPLHDGAAALWGSTAAHIANMIEGVNKPFQKKLIIEGIGYRAELSGAMLTLLLGFSHPIKVAVPQGLTIAVAKNVITIEGADKEKVGQFAAQIRALKKPEPYKGKGIRYEGEVVKRKQGKRSTA
ncbi:50S ribosomal protein L6 [Candidatus Kaiserbacteria bacterium RIFCSPHIGHO2_01_FULL_49_13]|uniref:Large ribosomal subunit protein uL6 n=1 Tax=Candidatus Kaiserbacteria bacterium RIFCSPHIGHO2_01_FULL_49_13 TaxID=1798477 RepID=A0A1F6CEH9_9BACT|nr:MAG: 50S ribosomal protein L6 [Candidatus Kaiserbacteria bacterium RIFCSPHIGHO2_01_FULL_49_13]